LLSKNWRNQKKINMKTTDLYNKMKEKNIYYIHHKLLFTRSAIVHYQNLTAIVVDDTQVKTATSENTVLIQELGHYLANAYYNTNNPYEFIKKMEDIADQKAWETFFPYKEIKKLIKKGLTTASQLARLLRCGSPLYGKMS